MDGFRNSECRNRHQTDAFSLDLAPPPTFQFVLDSFWGTPGAFWEPIWAQLGSNGSQNPGKAAQVVEKKNPRNHVSDWLDFWERSGLFFQFF